LIGFNDANFGEFSGSIRALGERSTAWRDIRTSVVTHDGACLRALDLFTALRNKGNKTSGKPAEIFHNMSFLSPAILYLGSFLQARGFSFDYINLFHLEKERLKEKLRAGGIRAVAVTTTLYVTPEPILEIVSFIRRCDPTVKIVVGGPYILKETIDASPDDVQRLCRYLDADFYVMSSEGEQTLARILAVLRGGGTFADIANCAYRTASGYRINPCLPEENRLEDTAIAYASFPRRDIGELVSIRTALSCPFSCAFCGFPQRAGRHRAAGPVHVEKELDALRDLGGVSTITFLDDSFNVPRTRFKEILRMMIRNRYGFKWNSFLRCDHVDAEIVELMKEAGCEGIFVGAESGNDEMLRRMNKSVRRRHFLETLPLFRKAGILSHMSLIVGFPGETDKSVRDTISLVEESQPDFYRAQLWYCDPMTPIWSKRDHYGIKGAGFNWTHNSMSSRTAIDWVEEMFMSVSGSLWLPQHGFELWSVFYLQRKGMSLEQVKRFLACFNAAVKEQVADKDRVDFSPRILGNLEAACAAGTVDLPHPEAVQAGSGAHYRKARAFWQEAFAAIRPLSPADDQVPGNMPGKAHVVRLMDAAGLREVARRLEVEEPVLALSLFTAILSRLYGEYEVSVAVILDDGPPLPIAFRVRWEGSFREHLDATADTLGQALAYGEYAAYFLESPFHAWADGVVWSRIQMGFRAGGAHRGGDLSGLTGRDIPLQFGLQDDGITLRAAESFMAMGAADDFARYFNQALTEIAENRERTIASLLAGEGESHAGSDDAAEDVEFQF
jgi:radical SAM PhpK family P-methyltransferase